MTIATDFKLGAHIAYKEYYKNVQNYVTWLHFKFADRCE